MLRLVLKDVAENRDLPSILRERLSTHALLGIANSVAIALPVIALIVFGYRRRWVAEDAFISLRIVRQILLGNGPVFNIGERVEAHSNPLWVAILTVFGAVGANTMQVAVYLGILFSAIGMFLAIVGAERLNRHFMSPANIDKPSLLIPVGALVFVAIPVVWDFVTSGLESGLGFGWLGLSFWILVRGAVAGQSTPPWHWYAGGFVLGLGPLVRPDFVIYSAGFLVVFLFLRIASRDYRILARDVALLVVSAGALPVSYQIFRMGYYAALVPNPALAKEAGDSRWEQGVIYFNDFIDTYWLWIPLALILGWWAVRLYGGVRGRDWPGAAVYVVPVVTAVAHTIYVIRVGGDFMHGRMLLPALFAILLPLAAIRIPVDTNLRAIAPALTIAVIAVWCVVCVAAFRSSLGGEIDDATGLIDERRYHIEETKHPNPVTIDDYVSHGMHWAVDGTIIRSIAEADPNSSPLLLLGRQYPSSDHLPSNLQLIVPGRGIGIFGYSAGPTVHIVDELGLADPIASRLIMSHRGRPGHEKSLPLIWIIARFSSIDVEEMGDPRFWSARSALECGQLAKLTDAVTTPLTPGRFLSNIRDSWSFHSMRIPPDPHAAAERFCGATPTYPHLFSGSRPE